MRNDVRPIVSGAMCVAFMGLFYLLNQLTGALLEVYLIFLSPLPSMLYTVKYNAKMGFWVVITGYLIGFILGNFTSVFYLAAGFLGGYVCALLMKANQSKAMQFAGLFIVLLIANFMMFFVFANLFGFNFTLEVETMAKMMSEIAFVSQVFSYQDLLMIMPVCMVFAIVLDAFLTGCVSYLLGQLIMLRLKWINPKQMIRKVKPSKWVGYLLMAGLIGFLFASKFRSNLTVYAVISVVGMIACGILTFYGMRGIGDYLKRKQRRQFKWIAWFFLILLMPMSFVLFGCLGFMYITSDFFENVLK